MRIDVASIKHHIRDQEYAPGKYFDRLGVDDKRAVTKEIATYAVALVTNLIGVKAERDKTTCL